MAIKLKMHKMLNYSFRRSWQNRNRAVIILITPSYPPV